MTTSRILRPGREQDPELPQKPARVKPWQRPSIIRCGYLAEIGVAGGALAFVEVRFGMRQRLLCRAFGPFGAGLSCPEDHVGFLGARRRRVLYAPKPTHY
jgi:hypothetical protein